MAQQGFNRARKRYNRLLWPAMAIYVVIILGGSWLIEEGTTPQWIVALVAIATALPVAATIWGIVRWIEETDEYTRMRHMKAFVRGSATVMSAIFVIGFLQLFEVIENFEIFWFGPAFFLAYGLFACVPMMFSRTV